MFTSFEYICYGSTAIINLISFGAEIAIILKVPTMKKLIAMYVKVIIILLTLFYLYIICYKCCPDARDTYVHWLLWC